jgi:hypothetical protein
MLNFKCDVKNKQNYYYKQGSARYLVPGGAKTENFRKIEGEVENSSDLIDNLG